ncbi:hypothetical protein I9W82_003194 [Candida metapsilosis]|uniref:Uncharacterized protein n=1 Tax=Candida metapsilosis TaxID=273372 RepID=A0A8H7ZCM4_9ASCO|nr:hypothetical protein I9W82_003194 [Candida metapsilosis]
MKSVTTFVELFQELNYNLSEKRLSSSGAVRLSKREIFAINASLNELAAGTPVTLNQVEIIKRCIGDLCSYIYHEDRCEERISYFLMHLYLNEFMRCHFCDLIKSLWPLLVKVNVQIHDSVLLHKLVDDCLSNCPAWNWLSADMLVKIATNGTIADLIRGALNTRENLAKFERMKHLNRDFTTLMNLIRLITTVGLDASFLPGLSTPYIKYIETINPNFKNLIQCSIESDTEELASHQCYVQPIDRHLLHIWVEFKHQFGCHHVNLKCLESFRTFPNLIVKLDLSCIMGPKTRSKRAATDAFNMTLAAMLSDGTIKRKLSMKLQMKNVLHFNWLVQYLSSLQKKRKVAINVVSDHHEAPPNGHLGSAVEKAKIQSFEARRGKRIYQSVGRERKGTNKRKKLSDEWDLTSDFDSTFEKTGTLGGTPHSGAVSKQVENEDGRSFSEKDQVGVKASRNEGTTNTITKRDEKDAEQVVGRDDCAPRECSQNPSQQDADVTKSSSRLFVPDESSKFEQDESSQIVMAPKERIDRLAKTQAPLQFDAQIPVRTSTPLNAEFTEWHSTTDKTSETEDTIDVMQEAFKLFSSNLINKLKRVEFEVLHKRNDLQAQVDHEYNKIEQMQRQKLKEIQEYCKTELNKIV